MLDDSESISAGVTLLGAQQFGLPAWWGGLSRGISRKGQALRANLGGQHPSEPRESSWNEKQPATAELSVEEAVAYAQPSRAPEPPNSPDPPRLHRALSH